MDKQQIKQLLGMITDAYPERFALSQSTPDIWHEMLRDLDVQPVLKALKKHIAISVFAPTVADIRRIVTEFEHPEIVQISADEAWAMIQPGFCAFNKRAFVASLPELVRDTVQAIGFQEIGQSTDPDIARAHFCKAYKERQERAFQRAQLPESLRLELQQADTHHALTSGQPALSVPPASPEENARIRALLAGIAPAQPPSKPHAAPAFATRMTVKSVQQPKPSVEEMKARLAEQKAQLLGGAA